MLLKGSGVLAEAAATKSAVAGFSIYNLEGAQAVCAVAEQTGLPLLMQAGSSAFGHAGRRALTRIAVDAAKGSAGAVGVHLDHCRDIEEIRYCLDAGYTSVMYDGSHLPFEENVAQTARVVEMAHRYGAWVEGELGAVAGDEDRSIAVSGQGPMTDPEQARRFAEETRVDALAIAIGNVHGLSAEGARLDLDRLEAIHRVCPTPLVLHGASGVPEEDLLGSIERGVVKFNVNTELRRAVLRAFAASLENSSESYNLAGLLASGRTAMAEQAITIARLLARSPEDTDSRPGQPTSARR